MSPSSSETQSLEAAAQSLRTLIQHLYEISLSIYAYNSSNSADILVSQIVELTERFHEVNGAAKAVNNVSIPREVIGYIEHGRNPDIYTREFVEIAVKQNQFLNGKQRAFREFRDVLAEQINTSFPELRQDVDNVLRSTAGAEERKMLTDGEEGSASGGGVNGKLEVNGQVAGGRAAPGESFASMTTEANGSGVF